MKIDLTKYKTVDKEESLVFNKKSLVKYSMEEDYFEIRKDDTKVWVVTLDFISGNKYFLIFMDKVEYYRFVETELSWFGKE